MRKRRYFKIMHQKNTTIKKFKEKVRMNSNNFYITNFSLLKYSHNSCRYDVFSTNKIDIEKTEINNIDLTVENGFGLNGAIVQLFSIFKNDYNFCGFIHFRRIPLSTSRISPIGNSNFHFRRFPLSPYSTFAGFHFSLIPLSQDSTFAEIHFRPIILNS